MSATATAVATSTPSDRAQLSGDAAHQSRRLNPSTDAADAEAAADGPPPVAMLHRHALESVFAFLRQGELTTALQVSRDWLGAAKSMASLLLKMGRPKVELRAIATSTMGRHVDQLGHFNDNNQSAGLINGDTLFILAHFMPQLRGLACDLPLPPAIVAAPLLFPASLRNLEIDLRTSATITAADVNSALRAVSRLSLLKSLDVYAKELDPLISFAPLTALAQLRDFLFWTGRFERELTEGQVDELRAMPQLHSFRPWPMTTNVLRRLLRQPHSLQWQHISLPPTPDGEATALLPQLPSLTKINHPAAGSSLDWLGGLPNLTDVRLSFSYAAAGAPGVAEPLVAALQTCANIKILAIECCADLTAAHLAELLPRLPRLRELALVGLRIDSLFFLAQPPLTDQLSSLTLSDCTQMPVTELRHVHSLRGLRQLILSHSFATPLDEHCRWLYTPPSVALPQLTMFEYEA